MKSHGSISAESAQKALRIRDIAKHGEEVAALRAEIDRLTALLAERDREAEMAHG